MAFTVKTTLILSAVNVCFYFVSVFCSFASVYDYVGKSLIHMYKLDDIINIVKNTSCLNNYTIIHSFEHNMDNLLKRMEVENKWIIVARNVGEIITDPQLGKIIVLKGDKRRQAKEFVQNMLWHPSRNIRIYKTYKHMIDFIGSYTKVAHRRIVPTLPPMVEYSE